MSNYMYELQYLPSFYYDLEEKVSYIAKELKNPQAANELIDAVEKAIVERQCNAESFEKYHSSKERRYPYYRIYVKNYVIYYVVINNGEHKIMEVRRMLYKKQNFSVVI